MGCSVTWQGLTGQTYSIAIDATVRESHTATSTITDHPVETGSNVSDHIRPDPDMLTLEGVISNAPIFLPADHAGGAREVNRQIDANWKGYNNQTTVSGAPKTLGDFGAPLNGPLGGPLGSIPIGLNDRAVIGRDVPGGSASAVVKTYSIEFDRVQACFDEFRRLRDERVLCRVITTRKTYENMGLLSFVDDIDSPIDAMKFTLEFKQVRFGKTANEPLPKIPTKKVSKGTASKEEEHSEDTGDESLLHMITSRENAED
jgi:hypothetical protein